MKYICPLLAAFLCIALTAPQASAEKKLLSPEELKTQFSEQTMTVTNARPDSKKGGKDEPFRAYLSEMGVTRTDYDDNPKHNRAWWVSDDGRLCFSRPFSRRHKGTTCGQIVGDEQGLYWMYQTRDIRDKSGKLVGMSKKDLLIMFSDFSPGNDL